HRAAPSQPGGSSTRSHSTPSESYRYRPPTRIASCATIVSTTNRPPPGRRSARAAPSALPRFASSTRQWRQWPSTIRSYGPEPGEARVGVALLVPGEPPVGLQPPVRHVVVEVRLHQRSSTGVRSPRHSGAERLGKRRTGGPAFPRSGAGGGWPPYRPSSWG